MSGDRKDDWCASEELAVGWAMHALEPDEEAVLRAHLPGCDRCQRAVRSTEEVTAALGGSVRQYEPPARLKARLMAVIEDTPQEPVSSPAQVRSSRRAEPVSLDSRRPQSAKRGRVLLAAAAVILVAVIAGVAGQQYVALRDQVAAERLRSDQLEKVLRLAGNPATGRAVLNSQSGDPVAVLLSGDGDDAAVMPMKLNPNDTSKQIYVMWGTSGKVPVPLATFDVEPDSSEIRLLAWSKASYAHSGFAISLEPGRTAPDAPTNPLAAGQVAKA